MVFPKENRFAIFKGNVLHGVIPGRSFTQNPEKRRITFMVAFWEDIHYRDNANGKPGSSMHFPKSHVLPCNYTWPDIFYNQTVNNRNSDNTNAADQLEILAVNYVWEDVDSRVNDIHNRAVKDLACLPSYDLCFQGF